MYSRCIFSGLAGWVAIVFALVLSGCAYEGGTVAVAKDAAPPHDADLIKFLEALPDPVVKAESRSQRGNGPVYEVWGQAYRVMESATDFWQEGAAFWYGTKFHGRETSSGERYDLYQLTAAHRHLPLPTYVRVTNLANGRQTVVRVNDRGPFHSDRIIDLSYAAAVKLGFHNQGIGQVRIEVLEPEPPQQHFMVQAGAFTEFARAQDSHEELQVLTGVRGVVIQLPDDGFYRVRLGPVLAHEVQRLQAILEAADYGKPTLIPTAAPMN
ncbi:MAG: septal ring lytic transglycosylase RlpA family protein [Gammaproteobacteria bacterium]|nr:septal ring lytic transglycosylase RlpA family protein [Gammaproteobacteria bacterium]